MPDALTLRLEPAAIMRKKPDERQGDADVEVKSPIVTGELARLRLGCKGKRQLDRPDTPSDDRHFDLTARCLDAEQNFERSEALGDNVSALGCQMRCKAAAGKVSCPDLVAAAPIEQAAGGRIGSGGGDDLEELIPDHQQRIVQAELGDIGPDTLLPIAPRPEDIGIIVAVQLVALGYGASTLWRGRPLYYAFSEDRLQLVQASDLSAREIGLARTSNPEFAPHWYSRCL